MIEGSDVWVLGDGEASFDEYDPTHDSFSLQSSTDIVPITSLEITKQFGKIISNPVVLFASVAAVLSYVIFKRAEDPGVATPPAVPAEEQAE